MLGTVTYLNYQCLDKKGADFTQTIDDAVARYISRWGDTPDHCLVHPERAKELGEVYESHGHTLHVVPHRIVSTTDVLVGLSEGSF